MHLKSLISFTIFISISLLSFGQQRNAICTKIISNISDTIFLDSLIILQNTFTLSDANGQKLDSNDYILNPEKAYLIINAKNLKLPLKAEYKVFNLELKKDYYHKKWKDAQYDSGRDQDFYTYYRNRAKKDDRVLLGLSDFQKEGSISRAVSVGNNQNLSVMSFMNLQIAGNISKDLELIASISDDNIPIQPDGNTQQLQDFDKVFIQLKHKNGQITAGDFIMQSPKSYFLKYHKKAQGANANVNILLKKNTRLNVYGGIAMSRGKYAKNDLPIIEGNQGPYKLLGANFERAIIILSGTERVFMDGKELSRGQNYDYIIDYNTAEITFMPNVPITKDKRIRVEFQYSDRNYARYMANVGFMLENKKWNFATHYYTENDLQNQMLDQELSNVQKQLLYGIGDSLHKAIMPSADSIAFNGDEVLYKKIDSLGYSPVYVYSTSKDSAFYRLRFSLVGVGNGNYVQKQSSANGRVFKWVAPVNGIPQGDYEPVVLLITPKAKQMMTAIGEYKIFGNTSLQAEIAASDEDINKFSPYDNGDNKAMAYKFLIQNKLNIGKSNKWVLVTKADYEFIDKNFTAIERFRAVEFKRDWNAQNISKNNQQKTGVSLQLANKKTAKIFYNFQKYWAGKEYGGLKNQFKTNINNSIWRFNGNISLTNTNELIRKTNFLRHFVNAERNFKILQIGIIENAEDNKFMHKQSDSLMLNSFRFQEFEIYTKNPDSSTHNLKLHYKWREDYLPLANKLNTAMQANELGLSYKMLKKRNQHLSMIMNYRKLGIIDTIISKAKPEETAMGRIEHYINILKGSIRAQSFYQLGSGMETRKDFSYIEVAAGQGVYSWNDYNNNGVKELNEFEIAAFKDQANYIRIYMPSTEYIKTYNNQFSTSIMVNPARLWRRSDNKILKFASRFANQFIFRSSLKTINSNWNDFINPFFQNINDTALMNLNTSLRNTFYFNRGHSKYGIDYTFLKNNHKILMMNGYQGRSRSEHKVKIRWNISRKFLFQIEGRMGNKLSISDYFKSKEFDIFYHKEKVKITYQPNRIFRISLPISIEQKQNKPQYGNQKSQAIELGLNAKYSILNKGSWTLSFKHINATYNQNVNGSIAFEMLQGFMPGQNYLWTINYQRNLLNNLQLSIMYNGRKSQDIDVVHVGSVQLRAFF